jgi:hypothetical protein
MTKFDGDTGWMYYANGHMDDFEKALGSIGLSIFHII